MQSSERTVGAAVGTRRAWIEALVAQLGYALLRGRRLILAIQWGMVAIYATLLIVPAFLPHSRRMAAAPGDEHSGWRGVPLPRASGTQPKPHRNEGQQ